MAVDHHRRQQDSQQQDLDGSPEGGSVQQWGAASLNWSVRSSSLEPRPSITVAT